MHLFLVSPQESFTGEAHVNLQIATNLGLQIEEILTDARFYGTGTVPTTLASCQLLVDAILGTGLRGTVRSPIATVINALNNLPIPILSVDLPSGLDADTGHPLGTCVQAERTVTIGLPKRGLLMHPGAELAGKLEVVDIGFPEQVVDAQDIKVNWTSATQASQWVPPRPAASHKGNYGRVLVVAGSTGMTGAAALASEAALRAGGGLVTLAIPQHLNPILRRSFTGDNDLATVRNGRREFGSIWDFKPPRICGKDELDPCNRSRAFATSRNSINSFTNWYARIGSRGSVYGWLLTPMD